MKQPHTSKVAISLPAHLLDAVDRAASAAGSSRSQYFREAAEAHLRVSARMESDQYIAAYREHPESAEDFEGLEAIAVALLSAEPFG